MGKFKKQVCLIIVFCVLVVAGSLDVLWAEEKASAQAEPQISFESTHYDAGEIWEGKEVIHTFTIKNTGTAQLTIEKVKPG